MTTHYSCMVALHNLLKLQNKKKVGKSRDFKIKIGIVKAG